VDIARLCKLVLQARRAIQILLGHGDLETTAKYLHLSQRHLRAIANPLEALPLSRIEEVNRQYHRKKNS